MFARLRQLLPTPALRAGAAVRLVVIAGLLWVFGRYWDPYYGFTAFIEADAATEALLPSSLRDAPIFIHRDAGRYDGAYYAQIATDPTLRDPEVKQAVDDLGYRARRILLSAIAWVAARGEAVTAVHVYAWMHPLLWLIFAVQAWRLFPLTAPRATWGWLGAVLASGALVSVRLALTDLAALILVAAGVGASERGREQAASRWLGAAALARETALLGAVSFWSSDFRQWRRAAGWVALAILPLAAWLLYVRAVAGPSGPGYKNFALPLTAWIGRGRELAAAIGVELNQGMLWGGWLDYLALTVQAAYVLARPEKQSAWWRVGLAYAALGICLGPSVWEGFPGAAARLLLPLTLAFNVLAVRRRAALAWLILGNLSVLGGLWAVREAPGRPHQLASGMHAGVSYVLETDARWSVAEWNRKWRWAWCAGEGELVLRVWPHQPRVRAEIQLRAVTARAVEIRHENLVVWRGSVGERPQWIALPELAIARGRLELELRSPSPPVAEGQDNTARGISFACFGARLKD